MGFGEGKENIDATNKYIDQIIEVGLTILPKERYTVFRRGSSLFLLGESNDYPKDQFKIKACRLQNLSPASKGSY